MNLQEKNLPKLSITQKSYLAGFIDGEGTISIYKRTDRTKPRPIFVIYNTHKETITTLAKWLGIGSLHLGGNPRKLKEGWKPCWKIFASSHSFVYELLKQLSPFLITKKKQAELVIEYCKKRLKNSEDIDLELMKKVQFLNKRGI